MTEAMFLEPETLAPVDRSTLETAAECPRKARAIELGRVLNTTLPMESGNGVHHAASVTIGEFVESRGNVSITDLSELFLQTLAASRPDVQPDVIRGGRAIAKSLAYYLQEMHYEDILCWDGGRGEHSSQLAYDLDEFGLRITSELDLMHATDSPEIVAVTDFKSGHAIWDHHDVRDSFQFQLHATLGLKRFPDAKAIEIRVWNTRINNLTYPVLFKREQLYNYEHRIRNAASAYFRTRGKEPNDCEAWPLVEKCESCPVAGICDASKMPEETPEQAVDLIALLEAKILTLRKVAIKALKERGDDIVTQSGNCFGTQKPKANRQPTYSIYSKSKTSKPEEPETSDA